MSIEIHGPRHVLEEFKLFLSDQFIRARYKQGPKLGSIDSGSAVSFVKENWIVSVHIGREDEKGNCLMYMESEQKIPELEEIWDKAIINYGKEILKRLRKYSIHKSRVIQELKRTVLSGGRET